MSLLHARSFGTISGLLDQPLPASLARRPTTPDKPLPLTPQPSDSMPLPLSSVDPEEDNDDETLLPKSMSTSSRSSAPTIVSKRDHALSELLASERSYASDLAVIGDVHVPLALGQPAPCSVVPATPPGSSGSSTRTLSTASDSSAASYLSVGGPPMTREDSKIIFNNVSELAVFADELSADLEKALGDVLEGGTGEDWVGKLFLQKITKLESLYRPYITKHSTAIEHLNNLPQTPALTAYLAQTRTLASTLTHAWDLPSLLIKPVQRLLKYPLLLTTIIEETPDSHPDKANLIAARDALEEFARGVNEGRRRREVVREVLGAPGAVTPQKGEMKVKKKGLNVGVAASVNLGRMKSLRNAVLKAKEGPAGNDEAEAVKKMGERLRQCEESMHQFAKEAVRWADSVRELMLALDEWAQSFGSVIWMDSNDERSEAFDAFLELISEQLLPICDETKDQIVDRLLPHIQSISDSATAPSRLLEAMHTLEPLHYGLLNINVSKSRPPLQLLEASQSYLALRAQLFADLPAYLRLFDKGLATCIYRFALIQQRFYSNVRDRWGDLWDALKVDEEANQGAAETLRVWWSRFAEVEVQIQGLNIIRPPEKNKHSPEKNKHRPPQTQSVVVSSVLAALDPLNIPHPPAGPSSFQTSPGPASAKKTRSLHSMESESHFMSERKSQESLHSKKSGKSGKSRRPSSSRVTSMAGSTLVDEPPYGHAYAAAAVAPLAALAPAPSKPTYSRMKSMPISPTPLNKSHSTGKYLDVDDPIPNNSSNPSIHSVAATLQEDSRGRPSRKPSFRRRLTDSFRTPNNAVDPRHRRSPSLPTYSTNPSPSPNHKSTFSTSISTGNATSGNRRRRPSGGAIPALYQCRVIHPCEPPLGVSYRDIGFFTLFVDDVYDILQEAGHPSTHRDLPLYVDDGEDCLLLARSEMGEVGWVLASFLLPVD
ncbi:hypothetical protein C8Q74DRAFT_1313919 [Fomes fomentarius]|nr:hypothetical protein C8Q74DRAFT_1313919 [Fomes fomentarius]